MPTPMPKTGIRRLAIMPHQPAVEVLAAGVERPHAGMQHVAVAARVEIGSADQHHAVEQIEQATQVGVIVGGGQHDRARRRPLITES